MLSLNPKRTGGEADEGGGREGSKYLLIWDNDMMLILFIQDRFMRKTSIPNFIQFRVNDAISGT